MFAYYTYNNDATTENDGTKSASCSFCGTTDTIIAEGTKINSANSGNPCPYPIETLVYTDENTALFIYKAYDNESCHKPSIGRTGNIAGKGGGKGGTQTTGYKLGKGEDGNLSI